MHVHQETLRNAGISVTSQRLAIAEILFARHQHLTADQLYIQVNQASDSVSRATVYNTLGLFSRKGLVNEISVDATGTFYDTNIKPHFHLYNVDTNTLTDMDHHPAMAQLNEIIPDDASLEGIDIVVRVRDKAV